MSSNYYNSTSNDDGTNDSCASCIFGSSTGPVTPQVALSNFGATASSRKGFWASFDNGGRRYTGPTRTKESDQSANSYGEGDDVDPTLSLGKELAKLSFQERLVITEELHGVQSGAIVEEEDPSFVQKRVHALYEEIQRIRPNQKEDYRKACFLAPTKYHRNLSFDLMFLRSTKFDAKAAARRIVDHFRYKVQLFGPEILAKDITVDDLSEEDMNAMKSGAFLVLATKDRAGRAIFFARMKFVPSQTKWESILRSNWYQAMTLIHGDESVQKLGAVMIDYSVDTTFSEQASIIRGHASSIPIYDSWPIRQVSKHYCYNDPTINAALNLYSRFGQHDGLVRSRYHCGVHMETQYDLMSFGISASSIPVDQNGNKKEGVVLSCIEHMKALEAAEGRTSHATTNIDAPTSSSAEIPPTTSKFIVADDRDVLLGRGVPIQSHPGNIHLSKIIDDRMEEFLNAPKTQKTIMTWEIVDHIKKDVRGRFLEMDKDNGAWIVAEDTAARSKVAVAFRSRLKKERKQQREQEQSSVAGQNANYIRKNPDGNWGMTFSTSHVQADKRMRLA